MSADDLFRRADDVYATAMAEHAETLERRRLEHAPTCVRKLLTTLGLETKPEDWLWVGYTKLEVFVDDLHFTCEPGTSTQGPRLRIHRFTDHEMLDVDSLRRLGELLTVNPRAAFLRSLRQEADDRGWRWCTTCHMYTSRTPGSGKIPCARRKIDEMEKR